MRVFFKLISGLVGLLSYGSRGTFPVFPFIHLSHSSRRNKYPVKLIFIVFYSLVYNQGLRRLRTSLCHINNYVQTFSAKLCNFCTFIMTGIIQICSFSVSGKIIHKTSVDDFVMRCAEYFLIKKKAKHFRMQSHSSTN